MVTQAFSGSGIQLKRGDGGVGAGTQASFSSGTTDSEIVIKAKEAGVAGNSKTAAILVAGNNTSFSIAVTSTSVIITSATDGSGNATTLVGEAISALYADAVFVKNFQATVGDGDGSGILVAKASANLAGGVDGAEDFAKIAEVKTIGGPNMSAAVIDVTNMDSLDNTREFISSWIDPGELTFGVNFLPGNAGQQALVTDMKNRLRRNYQLIWPDAGNTTAAMAGLVTGFQINNNLDAAVEANVTIKLTGFPTWFSE